MTPHNYTFWTDVQLRRKCIRWLNFLRLSLVKNKKEGTSKNNKKEGTSKQTSVSLQMSGFICLIYFNYVRTYRNGIFSIGAKNTQPATLHGCVLLSFVKFF